MINSNYFLLNVALLVVGTLAIRGSFITISGKMKISPKVKELFTYIPAAILPGLIMPSTFFHHGMVEWLGGNERFLILLASCIACYFYRNTLFVITLGLALLYLVTIGS